MSRLSDARQQLAEAFEVVLPGRVDPYPPPPNGGFVAPFIYVDQPDGMRSTIGERTVVMIATYPVVVTYDGADRAQVAGLDDVVAQVVDAVARVPRAEVARWRRQPADPSTPNRRMAVVEVDVTITATTLCPPVPVEAVIPPQPVEV